MKRLLTIALVLLATLLASAQNGTLNPTNPAEPMAQYKLTVACQPAEAATTSGSGNYNQGKSVSVRATAKTNYKFLYWLKDGVQQTTTSTSFSFTMPAADVKFVAVFEYVEPTPTPFDPSNPGEPQAQYKLTVACQPAEAATTSGSGNYTQGKSVTVRATAKTNYKFLYWLKDGVQQTTTSTSFSYIMPATDVAYVAVFEYVEPTPTPFNPSNPSEPNGSQDDVDNEENYIAIDATNFPDEAFRNYLLSQDYGSDGKLTEGEIAGVSSLQLFYDTQQNTVGHIYSLKGIEYFTALKHLDCSYHTSLASIDISKNTSLESLACISCGLTSLDVSKNTSLKSLVCYYNSLLYIDLSKNVALTSLSCGNNQLKSLGLSNNTALTSLSCDKNQLTSLNLANNVALTNVTCSNNKLTSLALSNNAMLKNLDCQENLLTALDLSKCTELTYLFCNNNRLRSLILPNSTQLTSIYCHSNYVQGDAMDALIASMPTVSRGTFVVVRDSDSEGNTCSNTHILTANQKGWTVYKQVLIGIEVMEPEPDDSGIIAFADDAVKAICVENWDINHDGELSMAEAAAVRDIGTVFKGKSTITSFDELQYFVNVKEIPQSAFYLCKNLTSIVLPGASIGYDWTDRITNPTPTSSSNGWNGDKPNTFDTSNNVAEFWDMSGAKLSQTIHNLPAGRYTLAVTALTRDGMHATLSANEHSVEIVTVPMSVANNRSQSRAWFDAGNGRNELTFDIVGEPQDVTITLTADATSCDHWLIWRNFTLTHYDDDSSSNLTSIGASAFNYCFRLKSVHIPGSVTSIGRSAFLNCNALTSVDIPNGVRSIGVSALSNCRISSVTIPQNTTSIGESLFEFSTSLNNIKVNVNNNVFDSRDNCNAIIRTADNMLIAGCRNTFIPNDVSAIGSYAFSGCSGLSSLTIPASVTSINLAAFYYCEGLVSVNIPNSVTSLGEYVFYGCSKLSSVTIPSKVTSIGSYAFDACSSLTSVTVGIATPLSIDANTFSNRTNATLYVPSGCKAAYEAAPYWKEFKTIVEMEPDNSNKIIFADAEVKRLCVSYWDTNGDGELSMYEASCVKDLETVFRGNSTIKTFDELRYFVNLKDIPNSAFRGCTGLTSITLPGTEEVDSWTPANATGYVPYMLYNVGSGEYLTKGNSWGTQASIGSESSAFRLELIPIGNNWFIRTGVSKYDYGIECFSENYCWVDQSHKKRCTWTFRQVGYDNGPIYNIISADDQQAGAGLHLTANSGNTIVGWDNEGSSAYAQWKVVTSGTNAVAMETVAPVGINRVGANAFTGCNALQSITLPTGMTTFGGSAFTDCDNLTSVTIYAHTPVSITADVFPNRANASLFVADGCKDAYKAADYWKEFKNIVVDPATDIQEVENGKCKLDNTSIYSISGQRLAKPQRGVNIIGGRKVVMK